MDSKFAALTVICLLLSVTPTLPNSVAISSQNFTPPKLPQVRDNISGTSVLPTGLYKSVPIVVTNNSYLLFGSRGNTSLSTALMSSQQFSSFQNLGGISNSIYDQNGTQFMNGLLLTPGTYYIVLYANGASVNASFLILGASLYASESTTFVREFIDVPPHGVLSIPIHYETLGSPSFLEFLGISNQTVLYSIYNGSSSVLTSAHPETVTNFTYSQYKVSLGYNMSLTKDVYTLLLNNTKHATTAVVFIDYRIVPRYVNPYLVTLFRSIPPAPTGIGALGLFNESGAITPYTVEASSMVGFSRIFSMLVGDQNLTGNTNANLQLNSILRVRNSENSTYLYWPQNVMRFITSTSISDRQVFYRNDVLNISEDGASLSNRTIEGSGYVAGDPISGYYYGNYNSTYMYNYDFPFVFLLYLNESIDNGVGVWIYTGVRVLENGSASTQSTSAGTPITWFDKILIVDPNAINASFVVAGDQYTPVGAGTPLGRFFDAELVFGGDLGGEAASFSSFNATLSLFYFNNGTLKSFPSIYPFGTDTAEAAYNLKASYASGSGYVALTTGAPNYSELSNNYTSSLAYLESSLVPVTPVENNDLVYGILLALIIVFGLLVYAYRRKKYL